MLLGMHSADRVTLEFSATIDCMSDHGVLHSQKEGISFNKQTNSLRMVTKRFT